MCPRSILDLLLLVDYRHHTDKTLLRIIILNYGCDEIKSNIKISISDSYTDIYNMVYNHVHNKYSI